MGVRSVKWKRLLATLGCAAGAAAIAVFSGRLNEPLGIALFSFGVIVLIASSLYLNRD